MRIESLIRRAARSIESLAPALSGLERDAPEHAGIRAAIERGYFTPEEDERIHAWYARYLTARSALHEVVEELRPFALGRVRADRDQQLRCFAAGYAGACMLVRAGRFLVTELAAERIVRRKLNEAEPRFRIPRKQFTAVYRSVTGKRNALRLLLAMRFADARRDELEALVEEPEMRPVIEALRDSEEAVRLGVRRYARARLRYRWHSVRRRGASASEQSLFALCEASGRVIAEARLPKPHGVTGAVREEVRALLRPGDVMITRHHQALSNLFLPGYWPHAALFVGTAGCKGDLGIELDDPHASHWIDALCVLEARKDGVLFRALEDTLSVDAVAVIRPLLARDDLRAAIARAIDHEGKLYNFDFDFFRADRLVCTEVIYRAYEGIGPIDLPLCRRSGRLTLSAEDLLAAALEGRGFVPVAVYGTPRSDRGLVTGAEAADAIRASMGG